MEKFEFLWGPLTGCWGYYRRLLRQFWSEIHPRLKEQAVAAIIGIMAAWTARSINWIPDDPWWTLGLAALPNIAIISASAILRAFAAPAHIDKRRIASMESMRRNAGAMRDRYRAELSKRNEQLKAATPQRSPAYQRTYNETGQKLQQCDANQRRAIRHLQIHGTFSFLINYPGGHPPVSPQSPLPFGMTPSEMYVSLEKCAELDLVTPTPRHEIIATFRNDYRDYRIAEGRAGAIEELFADPSMLP